MYFPYVEITRDSVYTKKVGYNEISEPIVTSFHRDAVVHHKGFTKVEYNEATMKLACSHWYPKKGNKPIRPIDVMEFWQHRYWATGMKSSCLVKKNKILNPEINKDLMLKIAKGKSYWRNKNKKINVSVFFQLSTKNIKLWKKTTPLHCV